MSFEIWIIEWLQSLRSTFLDYFFILITMFGEEVILICVLGLIYWCINKNVGEKIGLAIFISLGLNSIIKLAVARVRPCEAVSTIENLRPSTSSSYSFPSGHTQTASTLFFSVYNYFKKNWLLVFAIVITVLVAISRMYIGVHYLTDVLVGGVLGLLIALYLPKVLKNSDYSLIYKWLFVITNIALIAILSYNYFSNITDSVLNSYQLYFDSESIAKMFGTISGFILAVLYEKKYVNFTNHKCLKKNILRLVLGLALIMALRLLLKLGFSFIVDGETLTTGNGFLAVIAILLDYFRYMIMLFIGIGVYPKLFSKYNF